MSDQPRDGDNGAALGAASKSGVRRWWLRKRWWFVTIVAGFVAYNLVMVAYEEYQRAGYRAELASLPRTPCVEALTSPPLSELPIYIGGGYERSFPGTRAAQHFQILGGLECTKAEILPYFFQFWTELQSKEKIQNGTQDLYIIVYRDVFNVNIVNAVSHYSGLFGYRFFLYFDGESSDFLYLTMWPGQ
ncbi:MAG: hypothetical protein ACFB01_17475 [Cohaesibacteraceae bacterium]